MVGHEPEAGRSRRLEGERQQAILRATYELLGETGYQGLRVDAVAARAQASKATLYRHWPTKAELVGDAVRFCKAVGEALPDTGSLRGDLVAWFTEIAETITGEEGTVFAGLFVALHTEPELADQLRSLRDSKVPYAAAVVDRAVERGEIPPGADVTLIDEIVPPLMFMRRFSLGQTVDAAYVEHLVDDIIVPLLSRSRS